MRVERDLVRAGRIPALDAVARLTTRDVEDVDRGAAGRGQLEKEPRAIAEGLGSGEREAQRGAPAARRNGDQARRPPPQSVATRRVQVAAAQLEVLHEHAGEELRVLPARAVVVALL